MIPLQNSGLDPVAKKLLTAALAAADPERLLLKSIHLENDKLIAGPHQLSLPSKGRLMLIAIGKAAPGLTRAAMEHIGARVDNGLVTLLPGSDYRPPPPLRAFIGGHPLPTETSLAAGAYAADMVKDARPEDRLLVLVSGGGSAMFEHLPATISLDQIRDLTAAMLTAGMPIHELNQVRQALSLVKGGGLAQMAAPAMTIALILSDVVGNRLPLVASGPTAPSVSYDPGVQDLLQKHDLWQQLPQNIKNHLTDNPSFAPPIFQPINVLLGGNELVLAAAQQQLNSLGFQERVESTTMQGEASAVGRQMARSLKHLDPGQALLQGGETTVTVTGSGRGGRNQELALAAAIELEGGPACSLLSLATDGIDGNTQAAGAQVNEQTAAAIRNKGLNPVALLQNNDSNTALASVDALLHTGPTETNLNDLAVGWRPI